MTLRRLIYLSLCFLSGALMGTIDRTNVHPVGFWILLPLIICTSWYFFVFHDQLGNNKDNDETR